MRKLARWACCAVAVLALPRPAAADVSFELLYAVGERGIGREAFDRPADVIEDRDENIYVVDKGNNRIQVLDRRGRFVREWGGRGFVAGMFDTPTAMTVDPNTDRLYVVDSRNHRIQIFDEKGTFLRTTPAGKPLVNPLGRLGSGYGEFNKPSDVAVDRSGNIYVADTGNDRVQKFDASGRFIAEWGRYARQSRGVDIRNPVSVAYSDEGYGFLYVVNGTDCRVQKFELDGTLVGAWPIHLKGEGARCGPVHVRVEPRQYKVYIADTENDRVLLFSRDGERLAELKEGKVPFRKPGGLFVSTLFEETVIVADTGNNLIQKFRRAK